MKRQVLITITTALLIGLLLVTAAFAQNIRDVTQDTMWEGNASDGTVHGTTDPLIVEGGQSSCDPTRIPLLKWDLSDIDDGKIVGNATLTIPNVIVAVSTSSAVLGLFEAPDGWDETTTQVDLPTPPDPAGTPLATLPAGSVVAGSPLVFSATGTGDPLIQYIQTQMDTDNIASFWVEFTEGCPGGGTSIFSFNSKEGGTASLELSTPTNVTLTTFSADNTQPVNYALYAGLAALAVLGIGAVGYGYSRTR